MKLNQQTSNVDVGNSSPVEIMNSDGDALLVYGRESFGDKAMKSTETVSQFLHEYNIKEHKVNGVEQSPGDDEPDPIIADDEKGISKEITLTKRLSDCRAHDSSKGKHVHDYEKYDACSNKKYNHTCLEKAHWKGFELYNQGT